MGGEGGRKRREGGKGRERAGAELRGVGGGEGEVVGGGEGEVGVGGVVEGKASGLWVRTGLRVDWAEGALVGERRAVLLGR